jgi:hypothetical protein
MRYQEITWWPQAFHVFDGGERVGIVNAHTVQVKGKDKQIWFAHNKHFFSVGNEFTSRAQAASVLNTKPIKHGSNAFK